VEDLTMADVQKILADLLRQGFEARLSESGAVIIYDLRYRPDVPHCKLRPVPDGLVDSVFGNVEAVAEYLERQSGRAPAMDEPVDVNPGVAPAGWPQSDWNAHCEAVVRAWRKVPFSFADGDKLGGGPAVDEDEVPGKTAAAAAKEERGNIKAGGSNG
jgi:hypothetical protein